MVSGEESTSQVRLRAERIGAMHERLMLAAETDLAAVLGHIDAVRPGLLVLDSVQTFSMAGKGAGRAALDDRSSRPHRQPRRTPADRIAAIVDARYARQTAWTIAVRLQEFVRQANQGK